MSNEHLPFGFWALLYLHRTQPIIITYDLAPITFGVIGSLLDRQRNLLQVISHAKNEWETIFDAFADLIFVIDSKGRLVRCNHAVIDHLNTQYFKVIGKPLSEILASDNESAPENFSNSQKGFAWLGCLYDVSTVPIVVKDAESRSLFILRDITRRKEAEAALEQSESLFRGLFDLSPDAVVVIDPHDAGVSWPIIDCNLMACVMNGYQREEIIGHSVDVLNTTQGTLDERSTYLIRLREAGSLKFETDHRRKNGEIFPVEISTTLIRIGERELIIGIDRDITERKRTEENLANEKNLLRTLIDNLPDRIYVKDTQGRKTLCNTADMLASGVKTMQEVIGKTDFDTYPAELANKYWADDKFILDTQTPVLNREELGLDQNGNSVSVMTSKMPVKDNQGKVIGLVGIGRDITELKQAEAELLREKKLLETLNMNSPVAIVVLDTYQNIVSCNPAFENLYGYTSAEVVGKNLDSLVATQESLNEANLYTQQAMTSPVHALGKRRRKDGQFVDVEIFGVPIVI
ncbi:MAG: PAS domain S-box protein, partial [Chloroflexota bacterium]